jgi:DNA-binding MarR family transcriptional regulator
MSNREETPDYRDLMRSLHRAALLSDRVGERLFHDQIGIGRAQFLILRAIADGGLPSQQAIADRFSLTKGAVSRHVAVAERDGWLTIGPAPSSRREHSLTLTRAGRDLVERGRHLQADWEQAARVRLDPADVAAAVRVLGVICELLEREDKS